MDIQGWGHLYDGIKLQQIVNDILMSNKKDKVRGAVRKIITLCVFISGNR